MKQNEADSAPRVSVLFGAEVVEVDCATCTVTLNTGETHVGDVIIGADGARGVVRRMLMQEEDAVPGRDDSPTGLAVYMSVFFSFRVVYDNQICDRAVIPKSLTVNDPDLASFYEYPEVCIFDGLFQTSHNHHII
jgi:hypothetical protein